MQLPYQQCPYCGSDKFVIGYQHHEAMITYKPNSIFGSRVEYVICKNCGIVLGSRVDPSKFADANGVW